MSWRAVTPSGRRDLSHVYGMSNVHLGDVDNDHSGDIIGKARYEKFTGDDLESPAFIQAHGFSLEVDGYGNFYLLVHEDFLEVQVQHTAVNSSDLPFFEHGAAGGRFPVVPDDEIEQGIASSLFYHLLELADVHEDLDRLILVAVKHGRNLSLRTQST